MLLQALVLAALAISAVVLVALPLLRTPSTSDELDVVTEDMRARLDAVERRDSALAALSDLEFDHRTGAVSDDDYRSQVGGLRRAVSHALEEASDGPGGDAGPRQAPPEASPDGAPEADASPGYHRKA